MGISKFLLIPFLVFSVVTARGATLIELPTPPWDEVHELLITSEDAKLLSEMKIDTRGIRVADLPNAECATTLNLFPTAALTPAEEKYSSELLNLLKGEKIDHDLLEMVRVQLSWIANVPDTPDTTAQIQKLSEVAKTLPKGDSVEEVHNALGEAMQKARNYIQQLKNKIARSQTGIYLIQDRINFITQLMVRIEGYRDQLSPNEIPRKRYLNAVVLGSLQDDVSSLKNKKVIYELAVQLDLQLEDHAAKSLAKLEANF